MPPERSVGGQNLLGPLGWSAALHAAVFALLIIAARNNSSRLLPPIYRVEIVAAPAGERAVGTVDAEAAAVKTEPATTKSPAPVRKTAPTKSPAKKAAAARSTPVQGTKTSSKPVAAPRAGGGPTGDVGTDVATVRTEGIEFPFPGYLNNIVRQIALNFHPRDANASLRAEVMFIIRRDGSLAGNPIFVKKSGSYSFDLEAQGAVEAAAVSRTFGPLPDAFLDDALTVYFSFDPRILR